MIETDLTSISTNGWYADSGKTVDLLRAVSTYGWYGITVGDLVDYFQVADFTLIIKRLEEMGLQIAASSDIGSLDITTNLEKSLQITTIKDFELKR